MKAKSFYKNNKHNNMNPKEKENNQEEELKTQATPNECDEETVGQETSQENEAPLTEEEKLAQELEKANEQIEEQKDKYLRLSAEFDNYRKRTMKEKAELILNGGEKSISSILPIVDDFERALKNMETATDVAAVKEGVELISSGQESGRQNSRREIQGSGRSIRRTKQSGQACPLRSVRSCRTGWCRR